MLSRSDSGRSGIFSPLMIMIILGFFLLGLNQSQAERDSVKKPVHVNFSMMAYNAIPVSLIKVQFLQKNWIVNKDSFKLLAFNRNPTTTSKRSELRITYINKVRQSFIKMPQEIFLYHLSPPEPDDLNC